MKASRLVLALGIFGGIFPRSSQALPNIMGGRPPLKHAVVLVHGATLQGSRLRIGFLDFGEYFQSIPELFQQTGTVVKVVNLTTDSSIGERAAVLKNFLETDMKGVRVNLLCHSLGGLDARYLVSILKTKQVASITTIGTPHRGTPLADWAQDQVKRRGYWYLLFRLLGYDMATRRFLPEITTSAMRLFEEKVPDEPGVSYFSVRTRASFREGNLSLLLWFPSWWLASRGHDLSVHGDDGMVPYDSQLWGKEVASVSLDHLGQMNHHELRLRGMRAEALDMYARVYSALFAAGL